MLPTEKEGKPDVLWRRVTYSDSKRDFLQQRSHPECHNSMANASACYGLA